MNKSFTILVIDDSFVNLRLIEEMLSKEGYYVLTATDGSTGRKLAVNEQPDIILLDIVMPGEDGFEVCKKLKSNSVTSDIPVIFISSLNDVGSKIHGLTIGGWDYIHKPFNKAEALARVRNYLRLRLAYKQVIEEQAKRLKQIQDAQQAILVRPASLPAAGFAVYYVPYHEAGGDFYDVFQVSDNLFGYFVSDISGHDLGASFATSALKALIRQNSSQLYSVEEIISVINKILISLFSGGQHLTAVYATLDRKKMSFSMVNAAHPPAIYLPKDGEAVRLEPNSDVIGVFAEAQFEKIDITVSAGDRIILFTDGLIESFSDRVCSRAEGLARLEQACIMTRDMPCQEAIDGIVEFMFADNRTPEDDVLLLGIDI